MSKIVQFYAKSVVLHWWTSFFQRIGVIP